ncbi:uncharacterized protein LOC114528239 [Dendronephthya gigantea]|uniref:uncharacterized protein LOC114528239 n=1 Tax=Dendronephthya gigantea TaxID=151771 RepID=UPI00106DB4D5|nr:uncharacterized protein LOC114528239 [Dendronephthya gigantea]
MDSLVFTFLLLASATVISAVPFKWPAQFSDAGCLDEHPTKECKKYAAVEGYCEYEEDFMRKHCKKTCGFCQPQVPKGPSGECRDEIEGCAKHAANEGYCEYTNEFMGKFCRKTCGFCQPQPPIGGPTGEKFYWDKTAWGKCENGVEKRGVKCIHVFEGSEYPVDLKYCRDNLPDEVEPEDERSC